MNLLGLRSVSVSHVRWISPVEVHGSVTRSVVAVMVVVGGGELVTGAGKKPDDVSIYTKSINIEHNSSIFLF